jgi:hypothetical protein
MDRNVFFLIPRREFSTARPHRPPILRRPWRLRRHWLHRAHIQWRHHARLRKVPLVSTAIDSGPAPRRLDHSQAPLAMDSDPGSPVPPYEFFAREVEPADQSVEAAMTAHTRVRHHLNSLLHHCTAAWPRWTDVDRHPFKLRPRPCVEAMSGPSSSSCCPATGNNMSVLPLLPQGAGATAVSPPAREAGSQRLPWRGRCMPN